MHFKTILCKLFNKFESYSNKLTSHYSKLLFFRKPEVDKLTPLILCNTNTYTSRRTKY